MRAHASLLTAPGTEFISTADAKVHLKTSISAEDSLIDRMVKGVRNDVEEYLGRGLFTQTWKYVQDDWTERISLPYAAPLQSVTSLQYYDESGTLQTLDSGVYIVDTLQALGEIRRAPNQVWPTLQADRAGRVIVTYVVGWDDVANLPPGILDGLYLLLARRWAGRGDAAPDGSGPLDCAPAEACLAKHRRFWAPPVGCGS